MYKSQLYQVTSFPVWLRGGAIRIAAIVYPCVINNRRLNGFNLLVYESLSLDPANEVVLTPWDCLKCVISKVSKTRIPCFGAI
jgi:hypothetical protein